MRGHLRSGRSFAVTLLAGLLSAAAVAGAGQAKAPPPSSTCPAQPPLSQPFLPFGDSASYFLVPGGSMESARMSGWTLGGGVASVPGNETFYVNSARDKRSLAVPVASSATSPQVCVALTDPVMRFFAQNTGAASSTLRVEVLYNNAAGQASSLVIARLAGGAHWATAPIRILANAQAAANPDGTTKVAFKFTAEGSGGNWKIDDVYVDPRKGR